LCNRQPAGDRIESRTSFTGSSAELIVVGFLQEIDDRLGRRGLFEEVAEVVVTKMPGNVFQRPQVVAGTVRRGDQQEQYVNVFAVETRKLDAVFRQSDRGDEPVHGRLAEVNAQTLLIAGVLDTKYVEIATSMADAMPNARLNIIPEAGHAPHFESSEAFEAAVMEFLQDIARA